MTFIAIRHLTMNIVQRRLKSLKAKREEALARGLVAHSSLAESDLNKLAVRTKSPYETILGPFFFQNLLSDDVMTRWKMTPSSTHNQPPKVLLSLAMLTVANKGLKWSGVDEATIYCINFFGSYLGAPPELPKDVTIKETILGLPLLLTDVTTDNLKFVETHVNDAVGALLGAKATENDAYLLKLAELIPSGILPTEVMDQIKSVTAPTNSGVTTDLTLKFFRAFFKHPKDLLFLTALYITAKTFKGFAETPKIYSQLMLHFLLALRSGGKITDKAIESRFETLSTEFDIMADTVEITGMKVKATIEFTYHAIQRVLTDTGLLLSDVVDKLGLEIEPFADRTVLFKPLLAQIALAGQTSLSIILQAVPILGSDLYYLCRKNPTLRAETNLFLDYVKALNANVYLGMHIQGISRSISNLIYLCYLILTKYTGNATLMNYAGVGSSTNTIPVSQQAYLTAFVDKLIMEKQSLIDSIPDQETRLAEIERYVDLGKISQWIGIQLGPISKAAIGSAEDGTIDTVDGEKSQEFEAFFGSSSDGPPSPPGGPGDSGSGPQDPPGPGLGRGHKRHRPDLSSDEDESQEQPQASKGPGTKKAFVGVQESAEQPVVSSYLSIHPILPRDVPSLGISNS